MRKSTISAFLLSTMLFFSGGFVSADDEHDKDHDEQTPSLVLSPSHLYLRYDSETETAEFTANSVMPDRYPVLGYYLSVDPATSSRAFIKWGSAERIEYEVRDSASHDEVMSSSEAVSSADVLVGFFSDKNKHRRASNSLDVIALPGDFPAAGFYYALLTVNLWSGTFPGVRKANATLLATLNVRDMIGLSIVSDGAPYDSAATNVQFDFGELDIGDEYKADLIARANTTYKVEIRSKNGGTLNIATSGKHSVVDPSDKIAYAFYVDGRKLDLPQNSDVPLVPGEQTLTTKEGKRFKLKTRILEYDFPSAGEYSDVLTISIIKN